MKKAILAAAAMLLPFAINCAAAQKNVCAAPHAMAAPKKELEKKKPAPEMRAQGKGSVRNVLGQWEHGTCRIEGGEKLVYTYSVAGTQEETKSLDLAAVTGRPLAMLCSEKRTVILWTNGLEITNGADNVYFGQGTDISFSGSKAVFQDASALDGLLEKTDGGARAVFVRSNMRLSVWDIHFDGRKDKIGWFVLDDGLIGKTTLKASIGRHEKYCYTVAFPELKRSFYILMLKNRKIGVDESLPGKPPTPECKTGEQAPNL
jgi:hypothetical protein